MPQSNPELFKALVDALPLHFLRLLHQRVPQAYAEANNMAYLETLWEAPEAEYTMPHFRRAAIEAFIRKAATEAGLRAIVQPNSKASASYTLVRAHRFLITASYVDEPGKFLRNAQFRNSYAALNTLLAQRRFEEFDTSETLEGQPDDIYCVLLHGADVLDKTRLGFMEFAFPHASRNHWVQRYPFEDVLVSAQMRKAQVKLEDKAKPKLKPDAKEGGGG